MKKLARKIIQGITCLCLGIILCLPSFGYLNSIVYAEETSYTSYGLVSSLYDSVPSETLTKYNIPNSNTNTFTPFDYENGKRFEGKSFIFTADEDNQIIDQYVTVDRIENLNIEKDYSLNLWIYFDSIYLHNLSIKLELENGSTISWDFTVNELYNLIRKTISIDIAELPYSWNKLELPFYLATKTGEINDNQNLVPITKMHVDFSAGVSLGTETFAKLKFFDVVLSECEPEAAIKVNKQNYRIYSFNFFEDEILNSLCVGDSLTIPYRSQAINYAWSGETNLTDSRITSVQWRIVLQTPNQSEQYLYPTFGDKINFDMEGTYRIFYQCLDTTISTSDPIVSGNKEIIVNNLNAVYFNRSSDIGIETGKTYVLNVSTSSIFSEVSDLSFVSSSENLKVEYKGSGVVEITATKEGSYSITASVTGKRAASPESKEYSTTINITAENVNQNDNTILKIVLWCILGAFVLGFIVLGIILLVKSNKNGVK